MSSLKDPALMNAIEWFARARVYDLEQPRFHGMPCFPGLQASFTYYLYRQHQSQQRPEQQEELRTSASGLLVASDHSGTHIDALCHQAGDLRFHGGVPVDEKVQTPWGFTRLGAETIPPLIRKGVLLDVPAVRGEDPLPDGYEVTQGDLASCLEAERVAIDKGDVVLVRVGGGRLWRQGERYNRCAGVSAEATQWLARKGVVALGADNLSWSIPRTYGHFLLLVKKGVYIIENLYLEELAGDRCFSFLFVGLPLKIEGATGSPLRPLAVTSPSG